MSYPVFSVNIFICFLEKTNTVFWKKNNLLKKENYRPEYIQNLHNLKKVNFKVIKRLMQKFGMLIPNHIDLMTTKNPM